MEKTEDYPNISNNFEILEELLEDIKELGTEEGDNSDRKQSKEDEIANDPQNCKVNPMQPISDLLQQQKESVPKILMDEEMVEIEIGGLDF